MQWREEENAIMTEQTRDYGWCRLVRGTLEDGSDVGRRRCEGTTT